MATQFNFQDVVQNLEDIGFYDVALPFLLIFTITFAILQKIKIFGEQSKNFNAVIALVMAFLVVRSNAIVEIMNTFLPKISLLSLVIVVTLLLIGILFSKESSGVTGALGGWGIILTLIGVAIAFFSSTGAFGLTLPSWLNITGSDRYFLIALLLFFLIFVYHTAGTETSEKSFMKNLGEGIANLPNQFGKGGSK